MLTNDLQLSSGLGGLCHAVWCLTVVVLDLGVAALQEKVRISKPKTKKKGNN